MKQKIKIILADDHPVVRKGIASYLDEFESQRIKVIGEVENGKDLCDLLKTKEPDIIILDLEMPIMNGVEALEKIKKIYPKIKIIILSMYSESGYILKCFDLGANAYLLKEIKPEELKKAIYLVHDNGKYISEKTLAILNTNYETQISKSSFINQKMLNEIEVAILKLICLGKRNKEMAETLNISLGMIDHHIRIIKDKSGIESRAELVPYAIKNGYFILNYGLLN